MRHTKKEKQELVERYHNGESVWSICGQPGVAQSTFYTWLKSYKVTHTPSGYAVSADEFIKMKQHIAKLNQVIGVLCLLSNF